MSGQGGAKHPIQSLDDTDPPAYVKERGGEDNVLSREVSGEVSRAASL